MYGPSSGTNASAIEAGDDPEPDTGLQLGTGMDCFSTAGSVFQPFLGEGVARWNRLWPILAADGQLDERCLELTLRANRCRDDYAPAKRRFCARSVGQVRGNQKNGEHFDK